MGIVGNYIDGLTDEHKDRIVRAQNWKPGGFSYGAGNRMSAPPPENAGMCLVQHVRYPEHPWWDVRPFTVGTRFDHLCRRFGTERIVRACKLRAGASVEDLVEQGYEAREPAKAGT